MLSKVIQRAAAGDIQAFAFPNLPGYRPGADIHAPLEQASLVRATAGRDDADAATLREKIRQTEAQAASERRAAFDAGLKQGGQEARAEVEPVLRRLTDSVGEILAMRSGIRERAERDVVQLALLIAKRVLHRQLAVDSEALTAIARVAFNRLARSESWRVTVHPHFAAAIAKALPGGGARVQVEPDPDCAPGTLIIHSTDGKIDASVDTQLEEIERGLTDRLAQSEGD